LESLAEIGLTGKKIKIRVERHLVNNPKEFGKPLKGKLKGLWSYRCYDKYRVIYQLFQAELLILVVEVGHRREIY